MEKREVKFRAWDEDRKKMIYKFSNEKDSKPALLTDSEDGHLFCGDYMDNGDWQEPVLMQFTGLLDKNKNPIFDKDIIRSFFSNGDSCIHLVKWVDSEARFMIFQNGTKECGGISQGWIDQHQKEIIGNLPESPSLLTE